MADRKQSQEFLGGSPKFNQVGRDTRGPESTEEPFVPVSTTGYWLRVGLIGGVVLALAVALFLLSDRPLGRTTLPPSRIGGHTVTPDAKPTPPSDLR